jgi:hypothetical protein
VRQRLHLLNASAVSFWLQRRVSAMIRSSRRMGGQQRHRSNTCPGKQNLDYLRKWQLPKSANWEWTRCHILHIL